MKQVRGVLCAALSDCQSNLGRFTTSKECRNIGKIMYFEMELYEIIVLILK